LGCYPENESGEPNPWRGEESTAGEREVEGKKNCIPQKILGRLELSYDGKARK